MEAPDKLEGIQSAPTGAPVDRVFEALEAAALAAEGHAPATPASPLAVDDFRAAAKLDVKAVRARLDRVVMGEDPERGLDELLEAGPSRRIFPEVHAMVGFGDGEWRHKDVWKHTKQVVRQSVPRLEVRWAALFHDIGKVKTRSITPDGKVHFLGHAEVGTRMFEKLDRRMALFGTSRRSRTRCAFSSCTTCAPTSTRPTGPTAPCAASRASSASTWRICSASRAPTSPPSARKRSAGGSSRSRSSQQRIAGARRRRTREVPPLPAASATRS